MSAEGDVNAIATVVAWWARAFDVPRLLEVREHLRQMTNTNCWYASFDLKDGLLRAVDFELVLRTKEKGRTP